ncbi:MAG: hypothetical protein M1330_04350 [Armatimonadetes bacterium]|nr:hypothetical protein [Armatimonadota bacterium]
MKWRNRLYAIIHSRWSVLIVCVVIVWFIYVFVDPVLRRAREIGQTNLCGANLGYIGRGIRMYVSDFDDRLPIAGRWMDEGSLYLPRKGVLHCPVVVQTGHSDQYGYAYNRALSKRFYPLIISPRKTAGVYDSSNLKRNATDRLASRPIPPRHIFRLKGGRYRAVDLQVQLNGSLHALNQADLMMSLAGTKRSSEKK